LIGPIRMATIDGAPENPQAPRFFFDGPGDVVVRSLFVVELLNY